MLERSSISALVLILWMSCASAAGIDDDYIKPGSSKWGDVLERLLGQKGFGKSYALVIGVGDYDHYTNLSAPAADAVQVRNFLRDEALFDRIITLTDEKATRPRIESLMETILPQLVQSNDRFLFYFSGHGMTRTSPKRGYLILKSSKKNSWDEMIDMPRMREWADNFGNARHVLFLLDACFSGLFAVERKGGFDSRDQTVQRLMQPASHIITAGTEGEESFIFNEKSLFTAAFFAAARGALSMPSDGVISLSEMMVQISRALDAKRAELNFKMTPRRYDSRIENNAGEFFFLPNSIPRSNNPSPSVSAALEKKSDVDSTSVQANVSRGIGYFDKHEFDRAIAEYNQAIRLDPKHTLAFYNRGNAYAAKGDYARAIDDYTEAIRLDAKYATAFHSRGNAFYDKDDYDRAIDDFTEAIRLDPKHAEAFSNRGFAHSAKTDYDRAMADFNQAIRLDPKNPDTFYGRGNAYYDKNDYDRAITDYGQAILLDPKYTLAFYKRGNANHNKRNYDRAIGDYSQAILLDPKSAFAFNDRGNAYYDKNDYDRAIDDYNEAIRLEPSAMYFKNRGNAYYDKDDYDRAIDDFTEAIRLAPEYAWAFYWRGRAKLMKHDAPGGAADISKAQELDPTVGN